MHCRQSSNSILFSKSTVFLMAISVCAIASGQNKSTLGEFNKPKTTNKQGKKQKAPHRQLAKNFGQEKKVPSLLIDQEQTPKSADKKKNEKKANDKKAAPISEARLAELMKFVDTHHGALRPLLNQLKRTSKGQYDSAIRSLDRTVKSLQAQKSKSEERYKRSLDSWILSSKIQLLTARLARKDSEKEKANIRKQVRTLIIQQNKIRQDQLSSDLAAAEKRVAKLKKQQADLEASVEQEISKKLAYVEKTSNRIRSQHKKRAEKKKAIVKQNKPSSKDETEDTKQNNN